jgi:hypothetical protein
VRWPLRGGRGAADAAIPLSERPLLYALVDRVSYGKGTKEFVVTWWGCWLERRADGIVAGGYSCVGPRSPPCLSRAQSREARLRKNEESRAKLPLVSTFSS